MQSSTRHSSKRDAGVALILTLMMVSVIIVVTLDFNRRMRSDLVAAANIRDNTMLRFAAKSGFNFAMALLKQEAQDTGQRDTLNEKWSDKELLANELSQLTDLGDVKLEVKIVDYSGKIQVNALVPTHPQQEGEAAPPPSVKEAQRDLLVQFLMLPEFNIDEDDAKEMVASLIDWIDQDDNEYTFGATKGAEDSYYKGLDPPYKCNNAPVETISSLRKVKGFSEIPLTTFNEISKYLSPYCEQNAPGEINVNTADDIVLRALAEDDKVADLLGDINESRRDPSKEEELQNITWFTEILRTSGITIPQDLVATKSNVFWISATARLSDEGGEDRLTKSISGVVSRESVSSGGSPDEVQIVVKWQKIGGKEMDN
ncbi:MAG: type II secretion system minor pseudopilin GspK [Pseudomonadota bacterium]